MVSVTKMHTGRANIRSRARNQQVVDCLRIMLQVFSVDSHGAFLSIIGGFLGVCGCRCFSIDSAIKAKPPCTPTRRVACSACRPPTPWSSSRKYKVAFLSSLMCRTSEAHRKNHRSIKHSLTQLFLAAWHSPPSDMTFATLLTLAALEIW